MPDSLPVYRADFTEILIVFGLFVASAVWQWIKKKSGDQEEDWSEQTWPKKAEPPLSREKRVDPAKAWEEEIRRLLGGHPTPPPQAPPLPEPPDVRRTERPPIYVQGEEMEEHRHIFAEPRLEPPPLPRSLATITAHGDPEENRIHEMTESQQAFHRASHLHETVAAKLQHLRDFPQPIPQGRSHEKKTAPEVREVLRLFKNPRSTRQAFMATAILGPPKSLTE